MKRIFWLFLILTNMGFSQTLCFYLKGYINPVSRQINNSFNKSVFTIDEENVELNFVNSPNFPEIGFNLGAEKGKWFYELGFNCNQYNYTFITSTHFSFANQEVFQKKLFANTFGIRLSVGRDLKWNTSIHLLGELSLPVRTNYLSQDID